MNQDNFDLDELVDEDPFSQSLGIELVDHGPGYAVTELDVTDEMLNFHGIVHGGVVYTLADTAFAVAGHSRGDESVALEVNVSYLEPADPGTTLRASAEEVQGTRRTGTYEVTVKNEEDTLLAILRGRSYKFDD